MSRDRKVIRLADKYIADDGSEPEPTEAELDEVTHDHDHGRILGMLGELSPAEYGRRRDVLAADLDTTRGYLDLEYKERRKAAKASAKTTEIDDWSVEPWPDPVAGGDLLNRLSATAEDHLVLPPGAADTIALWTVFAHVHDAFPISPLLAITSPTPECGKTTLLTFLGGVVPRRLPGANITAAALFRAVEKWRPTLLIDEADTFLRESDELRGVLNSGHQRANAYVIRTTGEDHEPARFHTWSPKAVALIGKLPPTLASRAIHIELRRKTAAEHVEPLRLDRLDHLAPLLRMATRWAADNMEKLKEAEPLMPKALSGRAADNWRPLLSIADLAGANWPERARHVGERLSASRTEETVNIMLLEDVRRIFTERGADQITTGDMISTLVAMEDRPWPEWRGGKPITPRQFAKLLEPFEIKPDQLWISGAKHRGYGRDRFSDAFTRYLGVLSGSPVDPKETADYRAFDPVGPRKPLPDRSVQKSQNSADPTALPGNVPGAGQEDEQDAFEERAAILEYDGGLTRQQAEDASRRSS